MSKGLKIMSLRVINHGMSLSVLYLKLYLKQMSPLNAAICTTTYLERQTCYGPDKKIPFKKQLFDLEVMHPHTKQARSSLYANTQLRAHRRAEKNKK